MYLVIRNSFLVAAILATAIFYYWLNWTSEVPVLGGDHADYLLTADVLSPFASHGHDLARAVMPFAFFPPLYPMVLGVLGGTSAHIEIAHAVTITFLIAALMWYFVWSKEETQSVWLAFFITAVFAFLPTTFFQSFGILSEFFYLLLTLAAIKLLARSHAPLSHLYVAAALIGLAVITRMVGISLIMAFVIYLRIHRQERWARLTFISVVPLILWTIVKWAIGYTGGYLWIITSILKKTSLYDYLTNKMLMESHGLWTGWITSFDHYPSLTTLIVGSLVGAICLAGTLYRVYLKKFDGIYLLFFLGILVMWPFSQTNDSKRLLYVIVPILLLHGLNFTCHLMRHFSSVKRKIYGSAYLLVIALIAFPAVGLIFHRLAVAQAPENKEYINSFYWYWDQDPDRARMKINAYKRIILSWKRIPQVVPEGECVYNVDPTWLMLYAHRPSYTVPSVSTIDQFDKEANLCRYFYVASYARSPYPLFYPKNYIIQKGRVIFVDRMEEMPGKPILSMLIKMPKQHTSAVYKTIEMHE